MRRRLFLLLFIGFSVCVFCNDRDKEWVSLGNEYFSLEKYDKAIEMYSKAVESNPDNITGLKYLGYCYLETGDKDSALKYLKMAYEISRDIELKKEIEELETPAEKSQNEKDKKAFVKSKPVYFPSEGIFMALGNAEVSVKDRDLFNAGYNSALILREKNSSIGISCDYVKKHANSYEFNSFGESLLLPQDYNHINLYLGDDIAVLLGAGYVNSYDLTTGSYYDGYKDKVKLYGFNGSAAKRINDLVNVGASVFYREKITRFSKYDNGLFGADENAQNLTYSFDTVLKFSDKFQLGLRYGNKYIYDDAGYPVSDLLYGRDILNTNEYEDGYTVNGNITNIRMNRAYDCGIGLKSTGSRHDFSFDIGFNGYELDREDAGLRRNYKVNGKTWAMSYKFEFDDVIFKAYSRGVYLKGAQDMHGFVVGEYEIIKSANFISFAMRFTDQVMAIIEPYACSFELNNEFGLKAGIEYKLFDALCLRGGIILKRELIYTFGTGINAGGYNVDIAALMDRAQSGSFDMPVHNDNLKVSAGVSKSF